MDLGQENIRKDKNLLSNDNKIKFAENKSNKSFENNSKSNKLNGCISVSTKLEDIYNFLKYTLNYKNSKMNEFNIGLNI